MVVGVGVDGMDGRVMVLLVACKWARCCCFILFVSLLFFLSAFCLN